MLIFSSFYSAFDESFEFHCWRIRIFRVILTLKILGSQDPRPLESLRYSLSPYYHFYPSWFRRLWMNKLYGIILCCKHQPCTFWWIDEKNLFLLFKAYNLLSEGYVITLMSSFMKIFFSATLKEKNTHQEKWMENKFKWFYCLADSQ